MSRQGRKKLAHFSIVVADSRAPRDGRYVEKLGTYTPYLPSDNDKRVVLNTERVKYWLGVGAQPSERIAVLLHKAGLADAPVRTVRPKKSAPKAKAQERAKERADKAAAAAEAANTPAPSVEAPAA
jgi:small subunit ribosomal protein S16